jgi:hypothetical protein
MNREMLKEAIAEAKTIKETAIANAKAALEEAFTPQLTAMFAEKLNEMDTEEELEENYGMEEEGVSEELNLEEILAELGEGENEESLEEVDGMEDIADEDLETMIRDIINQEITAGNIEAGENFEAEEETEEEPEMGDEDVEIEAGDEDIENIDELLAELLNEDEDEEVKEAMDFRDDYVSGDTAIMAAAAVLAGVAGLAWSSLDKEKRAEYIAKAKNLPKLALQSIKQTLGLAEGEDEKKEMEETIAELRSELNEVNLLNAKLLYTNKIFKAKNLTESEKVKVLNTFDKAETVKEVKLVFETLTESFKATAKKAPIKESLGSASRTIAPAQTKQPIIEVNDAFARMQRLAGLRK